MMRNVTPVGAKAERLLADEEDKIKKLQKDICFENWSVGCSGKRCHFEKPALDDSLA